MKLLTIIIYLSITLLWSCMSNDSTESNESKVTQIDSTEIKRSKRDQTLKLLAKSYGANIEFENADFSTTFQFQEFLEINNKVIISGFHINDVEKINTNYFFTISTFFPKKIIQFSCSEEEFKKIASKFSETSFIKTFSDNYLILKINSIKKLKLKIDSSIDENSVGDPTTNIEIETSDMFICGAELIDVQSEIF